MNSQGDDDMLRQMRTLYIRSNNLLRTFYCCTIDTSARPEVRGTADVGWRSLNPLPINPPRTHSRLYHHMCLRTDGR